MINQFTRVLVGAIILLALLAFAVPKFFPRENADDIRLPREIVEQQKVNAGTEQQTAQNAENTVDEDDSMEEEFGYGDLLDDEGTNPPAEYADSAVKSGVVVGAEVNQGGRNGGFVPNPTITGNTPGEVAKMQADAQRKAQDEQNRNNAAKAEAARLAAEKSRIEAEKKAQAELARQEAERRAQAEAARLKAEADRRAQAELARQEAERRAQLEAERKAQLEAARTKAEAERKARESAAASVRVDSAPSGRYLQVGTFSTLVKANEVRDRLKSARIGVPKEYMKDMAPGFGYKVVPNNGNYTVLVGPARNDNLFKAIKYKVDRAAGVNSFAVSK